MADRTWVGGHNGNNALTAANWSPAGVPQPGDNLTVVTGTLDIAHTNLAGDVVHLQDAAEGGGPIVLDLNGKANIGVAGSLFFGDNPTINASGFDRLDASGGLSAITGTINLADHSHLVVTGRLEFAYTDFLHGPDDSTLINNGIIQTEDGTVSVPVRGTGTLGFSGYHDGHGFSQINAAISHGQTIALNPAVFGMTLDLTDPSTFHGTLDIVQPSFVSDGFVSVVLDGIKATSFALKGDRLTLKDGHQTVDTLRLADPGNVSISASYGPNSTTLDFLPPPATTT
jgi:hypothetical protein